MGRPRKVVTDTTTKEKRQYTKKVKTEQKSSKSVETLEREVQELITLSTAAVEAQIEAHQMASEAEEKFKDLAEVTEHSLNMMIYHCEKVQATTGSLTASDVEYSVTLLKRIIENKFKKD